MHFFYIDESGDTGKNLLDSHQPVMVLGGISLSDAKWNNTQIEFNQIINEYFQGEIPENFELHTKDLLSPRGDGSFENHQMKRRTELVKRLLGLLVSAGHSVHYIAFDKEKVSDIDCGATLCFNPSRPYELGFDYLITYINWFVKKRLGQSARGLIILDEKRDQYDNIERILNDRRFKTAKTHRVKWIVEFGYPIDSKKNPMIQLSDLVIYCVKRFLELDNGYRENWNQDVKTFYAECYEIILSRVAKTGLHPRGEKSKDIRRLNEYLKEVRITHNKGWKKKYGL